MSLLRNFAGGLRALFRKRQTESEMNEELRGYLDAAVREKLRGGMSREQALREARVEMGSPEAVKEEIRRAGWESHLESLWQDTRYATRAFRKNPSFTLVALLSLALGIGANAAIFSLLDALVLRALPVRAPGELVLFGKGHWAGSVDGLPDTSMQLFSYRFFRELRQKNEVFSEAAAIDSLPFNTHARVAGGENLEKVGAELVSGTYFTTLGVNPVLGRALTAADDQTPGGHPVAVASYSWWQRRFAKDPFVLGKTVTINFTAYAIIGVTPPEFFGTTVGRAPDLWIPLAMEKEVSPGWNGLEKPLFQSLYLIARLKPGVSAAQASADTNVLFQQFVHEAAGPKPSPKQVAAMQRAKIELTPAANGLSQLRLEFSSPLKVLMALVGLVLLIACANIANLLLARTGARRREIAVRMSLGAGRARLVRQLLTESLLLSFAGAALGLLLAGWATRLLLLMVSGAQETVPLRVALDGRVLIFALLITVLTALLFGAAPAFRSARFSPAPALKEGRGSASAAARNRFARGLIVGQVALSLVLLAGAALFVRSLVNLMNVDTGFNKQNVLQFQLDATAGGYAEDARLESLYEEIEGRVAALPGVSGASMSFFTFNQGGWTSGIRVPGRSQNEKDPEVANNIVGPQYFEVMGIPLVLGRTLSLKDTATAQKVAVINETLAKTYFPGGSPLGRSFSIGDDPKDQNIEVVGVVKDAKYFSLDEKPRPAAYYAHAQNVGYIPNLSVRYSGDPRAIIGEVRRTISGVDRNLPVSDAQTLESVVDDAVLNQRLIAQLSAFFGLLAVSLACIGIYGLMSYAVSRRTNEIGIRVALGANRSDVLWMVLREILLLVAIGLAIGVPAALAGSRYLRDMFFGLSPADPVSLVAATGLMLAVAVFAGYLPARRAARVDPMVALRCE
ncbi:MAG TPA: ABC transporter permease [Terriglobia bacterium]|nr:ABC transporter permease [Terriglobia bacterium]